MNDVSDDVVLRTVRLSKQYGRLTALRDLDLSVRRGRVYGFLGPNGAGKTTTIAMLLGLVAPTAGYAEVLGFDSRTHLTEALRRVGAVLEGQPYFPDLTARDNLRIWSILSGGVPEKRIDETLELVGLYGRRKDKVRTYSQGMKQRLGLAAALVHNPELLVLDEPTNGLDPAGIREFRSLFREVSAEGKTVFVSSHLLSEVELMCDDVGILHRGRLIAEGTVSEILRSGGALQVSTTDDRQAMELLRGLPGVNGVREEDGRLIVEVAQERAAEVSKALAERQIYISEMTPRTNRLEEFFLEVTRDEGG